MSVGLIAVSHSPRLAAGLVEVAKQMAPNVLLRGVGGTVTGALGTSADQVAAVVSAALAELGPAGKVVLCADLGSALMTVEAVVELYDLEEKAILAHGPFVEGLVFGAIAAQQGADATGVANAIAAAGKTWDSPEMAGGAWASPEAPAEGDVEEEAVARDVTIADPDGLHARPAALLARLAASFEAAITINGASATSVLSLMTLGARQGQQVTVAATGPQAEQAVTEICEALASGFARS